MVRCDGIRGRSEESNADVLGEPEPGHRSRSRRRDDALPGDLAALREASSQLVFHFQVNGRPVDWLDLTDDQLGMRPRR
jgi:hypothetical protein